MNAGPLILAGLSAGALALGWTRLSSRTRAIATIAVVGLAVWGGGVVHPPSLATIARDLGATLGSATYPVVGALAFLETGVGAGLIAPGELAVVMGGVTAGQGYTSLGLLMVIVWACALGGDLTSYWLGRRLGRQALLRHAAMLKLTPARLARVEHFLDRHGIKTIVIGRFVGLVRSLTPFVAGSSHMPARRFVPAAVLASGVWSAAFTILGYLSWQSFDQAQALAPRGSLALVALVIAGGGIVAAHHRWRARPGWGRGPIPLGPRRRHAGSR